jgi:hypothetical protein
MLPADGIIAAVSPHWEFGVSRWQLKNTLTYFQRQAVGLLRTIHLESAFPDCSALAWIALLGRLSTQTKPVLIPGVDTAGRLRATVTAMQRAARYHHWHQWFAWHPVIISSRGFRGVGRFWGLMWLRYVERRWTEGHTSGLGPRWIYRRVRTSNSTEGTEEMETEHRKVQLTFHFFYSFCLFGTVP